MKTLSEITKHFPNIEFSEKYLDVLKELSENEYACINIIGNAGSGKSTLLGIIHYAFEDENIVTCATTGVASALLNANNPNVKATTVHSTFGLKAQTIFSSVPDYINPKIREVIENIDIFIIDEISMANASLLDHILRIMYEIRRNALKEMPKIVLFGDVLQLPPVINNRDKTIKDFFDEEYDGKYFYFNSKVFKKMKFKVVQLSKIYRQDGDNSFKDVLNRIRVNKVTDDDLKLINSRVVDDCEFIADNENAIRLVTTNREVEMWNKLGNEMIPSEPIRIWSTFEGNFKESADYKQELYPDFIEVKIGSPIMITRNDSSENGRMFVNGDIGILEEINSENATVRLSNGNIVTVPKMETIAYEYGVEDEVNGNVVVKRVKANEVGKYINIPIRVCHSSTVHKCQGRTIDKGIIDLGGWITPSVVYVALSRFRSMNDFCLTRKITKEDIKVNMEAIEWLNCITENEDEKITDEIKNELMKRDRENIMKMIEKFEKEYGVKFN